MRHLHSIKHTTHQERTGALTIIKFNGKEPSVFSQNATGAQNRKERQNKPVLTFL